MIKEIQGSAQVAQANRSSAKSTAKATVDQFAKIFDEVNQDQLQADQKIASMVTGKNRDIPGAMIAMEKADTSLKLLMAVRNKVVSAYEDMMRMQV
ncbi:MAG: flagellar hook-basal body complex protein FliE [Candidatus Lambdaproteobacteria bacterium RIFOXYD12_FULL_49_8]|uniref:Flagellar hook-basal body complex protein FliE n=1 Tax=Candidatus Lambdaproteobacteria bacterium RIFOXYD2_FULL_50_16 TaxID=1817772 RepID=A0A1F6G9L6_9PROT|nr:MAG: flagellar hook-basal body complex protein FliE [Candidatus Lambdaproteobacteria bacterium RIFOXYD2_FULL_50_16]OGG96782.1 MAG: flagellar hook-basal body complex protein FliE [Candidatus Lambdaproteobacteria bacterium RIFOXYD12_FULL_49_8]